MNLKIMLLAAAAGFALALPALAADEPDTTKPGTTIATPDNEAKPPTLPATASARAKFVHEHIAFGKNGAEERAEHRHAKRADADDAKKADADDAKTAVHDALADKAGMPAKGPTLPATASDRARFVHDNIAFGKKGEAERTAHRQAGKKGGSDADDAHAAMANRAAHGAAADAQRAMDDNRSAAGQQHERSMRGGMTSGASPTMPRGGR